MFSKSFQRKYALTDQGLKTPKGRVLDGFWSTWWSWAAWASFTC